MVANAAGGTFVTSFAATVRSPSGQSHGKDARR
jgi:hypothetical protein